ncbi:MAG: hypothetical protein HRU46_02195 [Verrucomicrobiales bacterium]|nr:hypothetical protein [Verrucomicrobiales bacterium]
MKTVLKEFYGRDESLRKLPLEDQQRLFAEWAERRSISERLIIETFSWIKYAKCAALLLAFAAILAVSKSDHAINLVYWMLFLPSVILAVRGRYLVLTQAEQGSDGKPDTVAS